MNEEMTKAVELVVEYAKRCGVYNEHWTKAKNYAVRHGADKVTAKAAAEYVVANAEKYGVIVKMKKHGPHLSLAPYFAGSAK